MDLYSILWSIAFGICPQRPSHSLFFAGQQMPIEARMGGIFAGFVIGTAYIAAIGRGRAWRMPDRATTLILLAMVAWMGFDGLNAFLYDLQLPHIYAPALSVRLATGLLAGLATAGFVVPAFNSSVWQTGLDTPPLSTGWHLLGSVAILALYWAAGLSGWPALFLLVSIPAVLGVPLLLLALAVMIVASVTRKTNCAMNVRQLLPLLFAGLVLLVIGLAVSSAIRYALFGPGPIAMPGMP
jgi:uncharacterized membrane protein